MVETANCSGDRERNDWGSGLMWKRRKPETPTRAPMTGIESSAAPSSPEEESNDPFTPIIDAIEELNAPVTVIALAIAALTARGALDRREHLLLGLREETISTLMRCVDSNNTTEDLADDLEMYAALREYNNQVEMIANAESVVLQPRNIVLLATDLARFALDNSIDDLEVAARLFRAEEPERYYAHFKSANTSAEEPTSI